MSIAPTDRPLITHYPGIQHAISHVSLGSLPTPVERLQTLEQVLGVSDTRLYVKRDDLSGRPYGGNKVRKLEFLLARAAQQGYKEVLTFGGAGSNHALATAFFAQKLGMRGLLVLGPQHNSRHVRANLLSALQTTASLYPCAWKDTVRTAAHAFHEAWQADGVPPYVIPSGGSSLLGALGYVNAAFELQRQVREGILPEPDVLYVASGTMGTCIGLVVGLRLVSMKTRIVGVRVTTAPYTSLERAQALFQSTNLLLHRNDPDIPLLPWDESNFTLRDDFFGDEYALFTPEGMAAVRYARHDLGLQLEGTYTGKTFAALLADADAGNLAGKQVLFWNTYAGDDTALSASAAGGDWHRLPEPLHRYFEEPFQPLDSD